METKKRVGIYCRVSTKDQTSENQLLDLRKYCEARGWVIVAECVDNGISGAKDDRPQLRAVMELAKKRKIDALLVWRYDRLARSLSHLVRTLEELRSLGINFASYQESIDTATPQGRLVFGVMASLAEFERSLIADRVICGLRRAKAKGKHIGRPKAEFDAAKAKLLAQEGHSRSDIGRMLGVSRMTIARALAQNPYQNPGPASVGAAA